ncbi:MAG: hypothetical protein O3B41_11670 [Bacteroidetes bacterium]|nr:hypothetical protein [Bacteroidota bacterium]
MATSYRQDIDFVQAMTSVGMLEDAIAWIKDNLNPEDVFEKKQLDGWAEENGYVEEGGEE